MERLRKLKSGAKRHNTLFPTSNSAIVRQKQFEKQIDPYKNTFSTQLKDTNPALYRMRRLQQKQRTQEHREELLHRGLRQAERYLVMSRDELVKVAQSRNIDTSMPTKELQAEVFSSEVEDLHNRYTDDGYSFSEIALLKEQFVKTIEKTHFIGITAVTVNVPERVVRGWLKTDADFAQSVREAQKRMAERIGSALIYQGVTEGDTAALMFLVKQFGDVFKSVMQEDVDTTRDAQITAQVGDLSRLSYEEKLTLLSLIQKAKAPSDSTVLPNYTPTQFLEQEEEL